ncbi:MAG: hypothetical protein AAF799_39725 [Myxococcota bacterium]
MPNLSAVEAELSFTRPADVSADPEQPHRWRARTLEPDALLGRRAYDHHRCLITDCRSQGEAVPALRTHGFTTADLSARPPLQAAFERVRVAGTLSASDEATIRRLLRGAMLPLADGGRLWLLLIAPEGFLMRQAGPNGSSVNERATHRGASGHDAAMAVHADQDVTGTPLRQMLRGVAPWVFRHESPGGINRRSPMQLLNVWIPLQQCTRPLALMDQRTLDRSRHQLRYGLPTDAFLERSEGQRVNDIWTFLHDPGQRWYFTSDMGPQRAYVFSTLGTPHGAFILPGEDRAQRLRAQLLTAVHALESNDRADLERALREPEADSFHGRRTAGLQRAIDDMASRLSEARSLGPRLTERTVAADWSMRARVAADRAVRKSLEMRVVGLRLPPLRRPPR